MKAVAAVAATALLAPATAIGAKPPATYSGTTSLETKVSFRVATGQVKGFAVGYVAPCDDGETLRGTYRFKPTRLKDGRISVRGTSSGSLPDGRTTSSGLALSGRIASGRAKGAFAITTQMAKLDGDGVASCRSGRFTWSASRR